MREKQQSPRIPENNAGEECGPRLEGPGKRMGKDLMNRRRIQLLGPCSTPRSSTARSSSVIPPTTMRARELSLSPSLLLLPPPPPLPVYPW
ncbi:hypothetical protein CSHISOI_04246 [Colletotrichum shisoi]|uniref:Uncharacterized protein n=1 Tax=Colletotrichum shisoi TaxID=2078593 RepID=A0A5Q4BVY0_9PEZI|nr:hypothetical protein CSHISOI_04246 [Colletotrichum shisoi]